MKKQTKIFLVLGIILLLAVAYFYPRLGTQPAGEGAAPAGQKGGGDAEPLVVNVIQLKRKRSTISCKYLVPSYRMNQ